MRRLTREDAGKFDLLVGMDSANIRNMTRNAGEEYAPKIRMLLDFTDRPGAIADPWYTGEFETTFRDVREGCEGLIDWLYGEGII